VNELISSVITEFLLPYVRKMSLPVATNAVMM